MNVNYRTVASATDNLSGVNINLSAEYNDKNSPGLVTFGCNGMLTGEGESRHLNFNGTYDCVSGIFNSINGASLPSDFLPGLELKIVEFYNTIKGV